MILHHWWPKRRAPEGEQFTKHILGLGTRKVESAAGEDA